jgi:hypothetical protein
MALITTDNWDDLRFPLTGRNIDTTSGRIDYNYFNGGISFQNNARFPNEVVSMIAQMPHAWKEGSAIRPHIHWIQQATNIPNFLLGYRLLKKNTTNALVTDFTSHTFDVMQGQAYTYTSGNLEQIGSFTEIDMTGYGLSDIIHFVLFRDTENTSTEFAGADPSSLVEIIREFDIHYQTDLPGGSRQEFIK